MDTVAARVSELPGDRYRNAQLFTEGRRRPRRSTSVVFLEPRRSPVQVTTSRRAGRSAHQPNLPCKPIFGYVVIPVIVPLKAARWTDAEVLRRQRLQDSYGKS